MAVFCVEFKGSIKGLRIKVENLRKEIAETVINPA